MVNGTNDIASIVDLMFDDIPDIKPVTKSVASKFAKEPVQKRGALRMARSFKKPVHQSLEDFVLLAVQKPQKVNVANSAKQSLNLPGLEK